jgi:amino acid transporter
MLNNLRDKIENTGFTAPAGRSLGQECRTVALAAVIASVVLAISTIVAATMVSVGIARASAADGVIDNEGTLFAVALLLGLVFIGIGGFALLPPRNRHRH